MTIREYIQQKFNAFGTISEAELLDMSINGGFSLDDEYNESIAILVGVASAKFIEERAFAPVVKSVSENGFSASWDFSNLGKYYLFLCRKYGIASDSDVLARLGVKTIIDKTDIW